MTSGLQCDQRWTLAVPLANQKSESELQVKKIVKSLKIQIINYDTQAYFSVYYQYRSKVKFAE